MKIFKKEISKLYLIIFENNCILGLNGIYFNNVSFVLIVEN